MGAKKHEQAKTSDISRLLPLSLAHLAQQKKHDLNLLSSITKALMMHTLASFSGMQSCHEMSGQLTAPWVPPLLAHHGRLMTSCGAIFM